jgi:steroid delta-isomerase-like uncharacterized protein
MDIEANKTLARNYMSALDRHDIDAVVALVAPDLVNHAAIPEAQGADGLRRILGKLQKAFPDQRVSCDDIIAEGDRVVCRITTTGTNTGPLEFVRFPLPATGQSVTSTAIHVFRIAQGKIVEQWGASDAFATLRQLGLTPRPEVH